MKKATHSNSTDPISFWRTLPGILTCTAGFLLIIAVLLGFLLHFAEKRPNYAGTETIKPERTTCWSAGAEFPKVIPLSLKNSIHAKNYLYWLKVNIDNGCGYPLRLQVSFDFKQNPKHRVADFDPDLNALDFDVPPHSQFSRKFEPVLTFLKEDLEADLAVNWHLEDDKNNRFSGGSDAIHILPKDRIKWDLVMPDRSVPLNFLLASIAAWTLRPDPPVRETARQIFETIDEKTRNGEVSTLASTWVAQCYQRFFGNVREVIPDVDVWKRFPPVEDEVIRLPLQVINGGHFDPVETAVCLSALANAAGVLDRVKCALISGKLSKKANEPRFFLFAWRGNTRNANWSAFDIRHAPNHSFQENKGNATALLNRIFSDNPSLEKDLGRKGIFLSGQGGIVAIDFDRAATIYHIDALP